MVSRLWSKYDTENSGFVDKIEAMNFVNEVLSFKGQGKVKIFEFNQHFDLVDIKGEGSISKKDMKSLLELIIEDSASGTSSVNKKEGYLRSDPSSLIW